MDTALPQKGQILAFNGTLNEQPHIICPSPEDTVDIYRHFAQGSLHKHLIWQMGFLPRLRILLQTSLGDDFLHFVEYPVRRCPLFKWDLHNLSTPFEKWDLLQRILYLLCPTFLKAFYAEALKIC